MKSFEKLTTQEMANLSIAEARIYASKGDYTFEDVLLEVEKCRKILSDIVD